MKNKIIISVILILMGCWGQPNTKLFIKSVKISDKIRVDWYVYSSISNFSPDYLRISSNEMEPFFISFYLTNIRFENDSLFISLWKNSFEKFDQSKLNGIKVNIDTNGQHWNDAMSRVGRLNRTQVNMLKPHYIDTYSSRGY